MTLNPKKAPAPQWFINECEKEELSQASAMRYDTDSDEIVENNIVDDIAQLIKKGRNLIN